MKLKSAGLSNSLKGNGYWILNVLRAGNLIALLSVIAASIVMVGFPFINHKFFFFDFISHIVIILFAIFVGVSEAGICRKYFSRNWPILSAESHGFFWLGNILIALGFLTLSNLNEDALLQENIPMPVWRLILAAGILGITFGVLAWVATLIFGDRKARITARAVREKGSLAQGSKTYDDSYASHSVRTYAESYNEKEDSKASKWAGRAKRITQHFGGNKRPQISKPILQQEQDLESNHSEETMWRPDTRDRQSPIVEGLQRPPTAMHPAMTGMSRVSKYSEASHLPRF